METPTDIGNSVLALYPFHRGFAFAVLDSERGLVDWGVSRIDPQDDEELFARLDGIYSWYNPAVVAVENTAKTLRGPAAKQRTQGFVNWALLRRMRVTPISRDAMREYFGGTSDPEAIAKQVVAQHPELEFRLPPRRRVWESVDERIYLFMAVAFAMVADAAETGVQPRDS